MRRSGHVTVELSGRRAGDGIDRASLSDAVLLARIRRGEKASLDVLVARHLPAIERVARRRFADREDARDATQEALARLVQHIGSFRGDAEFATWLHRLAVNACIDHSRRLERRRRSETPEGAVCVLEAGGGGAEDVARPDIELELARLTSAQRRVLVMKDVLAMRYEDVARLLELPIGTVRSHAHRGRKRLAAHLRRPA